MSTPRTISFRITPEKVAQLDQIAKAMDRDRSYLLNEAVQTYLSEQQRYIAMVEEGLEASRKGELIDDEEVGRMIESWKQSGLREQKSKQQNVGATARKFAGRYRLQTISRISASTLLSRIGQQRTARSGGFARRFSSLPKIGRASCRERV